jgi:hypothetical protein
MNNIVYEIDKESLLEPFIININNIYDEILELDLNVIILTSMKDKVETYVKKYNNVLHILKNVNIVTSLIPFNNYVFMPVLSLILPNTLKHLINENKKITINKEHPIVEVINEQNYMNLKSCVYVSNKIYLFEGMNEDKIMTIIKKYFLEQENMILHK